MTAITRRIGLLTVAALTASIALLISPLAHATEAPGTVTLASGASASPLKLSWGRPLTDGVAFAGSPTNSAFVVGAPRSMNAHRLVGKDGVDDLVTGTFTLSPGSFASWGDAAYRVEGDTVVARSMTTGTDTVVLTSAQVLAPAVAAGESFARMTRQALQGDLVTWTLSGANGRAAVAWRNLKTGASGATPFSAGFRLVRRLIRGLCSYCVSRPGWEAVRQIH